MCTETRATRPMDRCLISLALEGDPMSRLWPLSGDVAAPRERRLLADRGIGARCVTVRP